MNLSNLINLDTSQCLTGDFTNIWEIATNLNNHMDDYIDPYPNDIIIDIIPMGNEFMASTQYIKIEAIIQSNFYSATLHNCKSEDEYKTSEFYNVLTQIHNKLQNYEPVLYNDYAYYLNKLLNQYPNKKLIEIRNFINNHHISEIKGGNHDV